MQIRRFLTPVAVLALLLTLPACATDQISAVGNPEVTATSGLDDVTPTPAATPTSSTATPEPSHTALPVPSGTSPTPTPTPTSNPGKILLKQGDSGPQVKELQARLKQIGWFNTDVTGNYGPVTVEAVKGFQKKRGLVPTGSYDETTQGRLLGMTRKPTTDELENRTPPPKPKPVTNPGELDPRCMTGRVLCISKTTRQLNWVVDGEVLMSMDVRFGRPGTPTREGEFRVNSKNRKDYSTIYHTSMPFAMYFSGGQAIHYSSDFAAVGYNGGSGGCVNVRDYGAIEALFDQVRIGDKVIIYW